MAQSMLCEQPVAPKKYPGESSGSQDQAGDRFCNKKTQLSVIKRRSQQPGITLSSGLPWLIMNEQCRS